MDEDGRNKYGARDFVGLDGLPDRAEVDFRDENDGRKCERRGGRSKCGWAGAAGKRCE